MIDRVDEHDRPVGCVPRGKALELGANFRTVHVFVYHGRELLLQQLAPTRDRHPARWGSSVAAYLHTGESYEQAAQRRLREELGLEGMLSRVGKTRMKDERSLKFVALYTLYDGPAEIRDAAHIAALRYWDRGELQETIAETPRSFTPTFLHVYRYLEQRALTPRI